MAEKQANEQADKQAIFEAARKLDSAEAREACLQRMCGGDAELTRQVTALLRAYDPSDSFLESPPFGLDPAPTDRSTHPPPWAAYREARAPGSAPTSCWNRSAKAALGVVYMAEQTEPVRRKVALKIIKPGMDTQGGDRPLRGRAAGPGHDGPPEHRQGARRREPPSRAGPTS